MKKHYIRLTAIIGALILVAALLGVLFFTYLKIDQVNDEYMAKCALEGDMLDLRWPDKAGDFPETIKSLYFGTWKVASQRDRNFGFHGELIWNDGQERTLAASDYIRLYNYVYETDSKTSATLMDIEDAKIILVDDSFEDVAGSDQLWDLDINAQCDETFIFDGTITFRTTAGGDFTTYRIGTPELAVTQGSQNAHDWQSSREIYAEYVNMSPEKGQAALDRKAAEVFQKFYERWSKGDLTVDSLEQGWFLSYQVIGINYNAGEIPVAIYAAYTFNPMKIVLERNLVEYILFAIVLLALEIMVILVSRKMYRERRNFELRSRQLTRSIAHDLKTPLAVTRAYVENWEYIDEDDRRQYAENITTEVDHMAKMVSNLLDLSSLDSGDREPQKEDVDLLSLSKALLRRLDPLISEKHMEVSVLPDKEDAEYLVYADLEMMKILIGNFLSNAVKYGKEKVKIELSDNGRSITFRITNDGQGISKKDLKKIWDPMYKTDTARTSRFGSNGVGLSVNKSILKLHKAKYGCRSNTFDTTFWFEMKKAPEAPADPEDA